MTASIAAPTKPGFYWAKWKIADEGTREGEELTPSNRWEVVEVFMNCVDVKHPEHLGVNVFGVEKMQSIENFYWGQGPLQEPRA